MVRDYEAVIGLEVHCQLSTNSKIFCGCPSKGPQGVSVGEIEANSNTCPICAGHPGTLPVLNRKVVEYAIRAGLATHSDINTTNVFARKNYFYPDLPKGYQISQYDRPICENGWLTIETKDGKKKINIHRIHMEEDAGKSVHMSGYSLVNLNRAGVPLIEIVSSPDMRSAEEAGAYLRALYAVVTYLGICDGNMQEGNFRCDANVSIRPKGSQEFGTRAEIKNINSFRFVEKAIEYEIERQIDVIESGDRVIQETRTYDSVKNITLSMRSKEEAQDYRYFPDPDLIPLQLDLAWINEIRDSLPELPEQKRNRYISDFGLSPYDAMVVTSSKAMAGFFEAVVANLHQGGMEPKHAAKPAANWITGEVTRLTKDEGIEIEASQLRPEHVADVIRLVHTHVLSSTGAKQAIQQAWKSGASIQKTVEQLGLAQVSDSAALESVIDRVISAFPAQVGELRSGKEKVLGFLVGQIMKETGGKANPGLAGELLKKKIFKE